MTNFALQSEFLFIWDCENSNPNGDMLNDNAPRFDDISSKALVSDVRIKRTIRDFIIDSGLSEKEGYQIFVREEKMDKGLADGKQRVQTITEGKKEEVVETILNKCIDARAFGGVFPVAKETNNLTGAIQFKMTKSINETEVVFIKGTGAFASSAGKENKTFREEYILPYAVFGTYGVINNFSATTTKLTEEDVSVILKSMWLGTKNLLTRSKMGQMPRFLLKITYKEPGYFIGELDNLIKLECKKATENEIRTIEDYRLNFQQLVEKTEEYKDKIAKIEYLCDSRYADTIQTIDKNWENLDLGL